MYEDYKQMILEGLTQCRDFEDTYILLLREKEGHRFLPVLINGDEYQTIYRAVRENEYPNTRLMNRLATRLGMPLMGIRVMVPANGHTNALIDFDRNGELVSIQAPVDEAVAAAHEVKAPIWVPAAELDLRLKMPNEEGKMSVPINSMSNELLETVLREAVEHDNFELATVLRDELRKRN